VMQQAQAFVQRPAVLRVLRVMFVGMVLSVLVLALMPASHGASWFPQADKLQHAFAFVALWTLGLRARVGRGMVLAAGLLLFGVGIEVAQSFTPDREPSVFDVLADTAGIALGWRFQRPTG
jgi:VanZ family protein